MSHENNFLTKEDTGFIKGVALVFMFIHHFFTLPKEVYVEQVRFLYNESFANWFCAPFKICVSIFAFITGYVYFYSKKKNIRYSIKKATDLWLGYVVVMLIVLVPLAAMNLYSFTPLDFSLDLFALTRTIISFNWYVIFYVIAIFLLPVFSRVVDKQPVLTIILSIILSLLVWKTIPGLIPEQLAILRQIPDDMQWLPCVISGYVFAKFNLFNVAQDTLNSRKTFQKLLVYFIILIISFASRNYIPEFDFVTVPLFVFGLTSIFHMIKLKTLLRPIDFIGKYSMYMWFFHCIFFNALNRFTQPVIFYPQIPLLVLCFGLILCIIPSIIIDYPIKKLIRVKDQIIKYRV